MPAAGKAIAVVLLVFSVIVFAANLAYEIALVNQGTMRIAPPLRRMSMFVSIPVMLVATYFLVRRAGGGDKATGAARTFKVILACFGVSGGVLIVSFVIGYIMLGEPVAWFFEAHFVLLAFVLAVLVYPFVNRRLR